MSTQNRPLYRLATTAIIYKKDRGEIFYLIAQRAKVGQAFYGRWDLPGGGLEKEDCDYTPANRDGCRYGVLVASLKREIREEVNLTVGEFRYLSDCFFILPDGQPMVLLNFYTPYLAGEVVLNEENSAFAWVTAMEAEKYDLVDGVLNDILALDRILKNHVDRKPKNC